MGGASADALGSIAAAPPDRLIEASTAEAHVNWTHSQRSECELLSQLTNRELSALIWLGLMSVSAILCAPTRRSVFSFAGGLWRSRKLLYIVVVLAAYSAAAAALLARAGLWSPSLIKDTTIWFLFAGLGLAAKAIQPGESEHFFRDALSEQLQVLVLIEFLVSSYTLSLTAEFVLTPVLFLVTAVQAIASLRHEHRSVERLASAILSLAGLALVVNAVVTMVQTFTPNAAGPTIQAIVAPPLLTALLLPAVIVLALYSASENLGLQLQSWRPERRALGMYATRRIMWHCRLRPLAVRRFSREYRLELMRIRTREDVDALLRTAEAGVRGEAQAEH